MRILKLIPTNQEEVINQTLAVLKSGGLVVFPSDTVYGLLADAKNPAAVSRLLAFKERIPGKAVSVFVADKKMAEKYIIRSQNAENVIKNLLPGPFTVVAQSRHETDPRLEAENGTLGIRIPAYPLLVRLVSSFGRPLTATSANLSGKPPVYSISALEKILSKTKKNLLSLEVDAGNLPKNKPSTVIDTTTGQLKTLRIGDFLPQTANSLVSNSEEQTKEFGRFLAAKFIKKCPGKPIVFLLEGELGAGKTILAKGLGKALGVEEEIASPTFNICLEYPLPDGENYPSLMTGIDMESHHQNISKKNKRKFVHCDFYRIEAKEELAELGFPESVICGNVYAIEWAERIPAEIISALKNRAEIVFLQLRNTGKDQRTIEWGFDQEK